VAPSPDTVADSRSGFEDERHESSRNRVSRGGQANRASANDDDRKRLL
jgi:hypothetical protein